MTTTLLLRPGAPLRQEANPEYGCRRLSRALSILVFPPFAGMVSEQVVPTEGA